MSTTIELIRVVRADEKLRLTTRADIRIGLPGRAVPQMPFVVSSKVGAVEPILDFLLERASMRSASPGTLDHYAYILRDWFRYLAYRGVSWHVVDDFLLFDWLRYLELSVSRNGRHIRDGRDHSLGERRIQTKINVVALFYRTITALYETRGHRDTPLGFTCRISKDPGRDPSKEDGKAAPLRVRYATIEDNNVGRPTPSDQEISQLLEGALSSGRDYSAICRWFWLKWMRECGLRAMEVAGLTLGMLHAALIRIGIPMPTPSRERPSSLHELSEDSIGQSRLLEALVELQHYGRRELFIRVVGKRKKRRDVGVPIDFFIQVLNYVWDSRAAYIEKQKNLGGDLSCSQALWFSQKTNRAPKPKSIADSVGERFRKSGIAGSGHRLRARYAVEQMRNEIRDQLSRHGRIIDKHTILFLVAQRLGHADLNSLEYYLTEALQQIHPLEDEFVQVRNRDAIPRINRLLRLIEAHPADTLAALDALLDDQDDGPPPQPSRCKVS